MAHTNKTPNFDLPQFVANDTPAWLTDINGAFLDIDGDMKNIQDTAQSASSTATGAAGQVATIQATVDTLSGTVTTMQGQVTTNTQNIATNTTAIGTTDGKVTALTGRVDTAEDEIAALQSMGGIALYTHQKQGTIHVLTGDTSAQNIKFYATSPFTANDTFLVNGVAKTIVTMNGEALPNNFFVTGAGVMALLAGDNIYFF